MIDIVATYIMLHNICIIDKNKFDMKWIQKIESEFEKWINNRSLRERQEIKNRIIIISEVKNISSTKNNARRAEEVDKDTAIFLIKFSFWWMRAFTLQWSWVLSLVCEVDLSVSFHIGRSFIRF